MQSRTTLRPDGMAYTLTFTPARHDPPVIPSLNVSPHSNTQNKLFWEDMQWRINKSLAVLARYKTVEKAERELAKVDAARIRREMGRKHKKSLALPLDESSNMVPTGAGIDSRYLV
eukprot:gnl/Chilomastix_caulleri/1588.p1 GENE.gnl/Chilomastix_caulleri/1588~~gnl/Chilomastix_caulleri/1588.p1  ORF type:complete len:116 (+),score=6.05 gnl/Chilomastix_caulleri/1588:51-398(+)